VASEWNQKACVDGLGMHSSLQHIISNSSTVVWKHRLIIVFHMGKDLMHILQVFLFMKNSQSRPFWILMKEHSVVHKENRYSVI